MFVPGWNAHLKLDGAGAGTITHVGIRAHYIAPCEASAPNALRCRVVEAADDVFSCVLTLLPASGTQTIRAELSKSAAQGIVIGSEAWFCLPKNAVMPLSETHQI